MKKQYKKICAIAASACLSYFMSSCDEQGELEEALGSVVSDYIVLDLDTGVSVGVKDITDLLTNTKYKTTHMVFRKVSSTIASIGSPSDAFVYESDETQQLTTIDKYFIGVFEVTRGQWDKISTTTPWTSVTPSSITSESTQSTSSPIYGISYTTAAQEVLAYNTKLSLPTNIQWEHACRAGNAGLFCWGDDKTTTTALNYAAVWETMEGEKGPVATATYAANAYGLYDMHGNVWEWTKDKDLKGGSWNDPLILSRSANIQKCDEDIAHALTGIRLVYTP